MENENRYINIEKVGQGTYGAVYKGRDTQTKDVSQILSFRLLPLSKYSSKITKKASHQQHYEKFHF